MHSIKRELQIPIGSSHQSYLTIGMPRQTSGQVYSYIFLWLPSFSADACKNNTMKVIFSIDFLGNNSKDKILGSFNWFQPFQKMCLPRKNELFLFISFQTFTIFQILQLFTDLSKTDWTKITKNKAYSKNIGRIYT